MADSSVHLEAARAVRSRSVRNRPHYCYTSGKVAKFNSGTSMVIVAYSAFDAAKLFEADLGKTLPLDNSRQQPLELFDGLAAK